MRKYWGHQLGVGTSPRVSVPVAKRTMNLPVNCDAGVHSWYLAVSEEFPFFDLFLDADCIGVLARGSFFEIQVFHSFRTDLCTFLNLVPSRLYRSFSESPLFCHFCHLRFSVLTPVHRVRDPLVFCDDSGEVLDFLNFFTGFC